MQCQKISIEDYQQPDANGHFGAYGGTFVAETLMQPLAELRQRQAEIPRDRPIVVFCQGGYRSMIASSLLRAAGHRNVRDLRGGYSTLES